MQALTAPLKELAEYEEIAKGSREGPGVTRISGCVNSQKTHMMYALCDGFTYKVIACSSESKARQIYEEYRALFVSGKGYALLSGGYQEPRAGAAADGGYRGAGRK